jgi:hypothetical protein
MKTYTVASCASGCAFHSTVGDTMCRMCDGPMAAPVTKDRAGMLALIRNEDAYQAGKRQAIREMLTARYRGAVPVTDEMVDAVLAGV